MIVLGRAPGHFSMMQRALGNCHPSRRRRNCDLRLESLAFAARGICCFVAYEKADPPGRVSFNDTIGSYASGLRDDSFYSFQKARNHSALAADSIVVLTAPGRRVH